MYPKYLGISGLGQTSSSLLPEAVRKFNAIPFLGYWDIVKNYYANKQEEIGFVIHNNLKSNSDIDGVKYTDYAGDVVLHVLATPPTTAEAYRDWETDRKSTRLNSSHITRSRMPSSA